MMNAQKEHFRIICEFNDTQDDEQRLPPSYRAVEYARAHIAQLEQSLSWALSCLDIWGWQDDPGMEEAVSNLNRAKELLPTPPQTGEEK